MSPTRRHTDDTHCRLGAFLIVVTAGPVRAQNVSEPLTSATFAQQICAECHAVPPGQPRSSNGQAPTFETAAKTPGMTGIALTAILRSSYRTMPTIVLADDDLRNVIAIHTADYQLAVDVRSFQVSNWLDVTEQPTACPMTQVAFAANILDDNGRIIGS